MSFFKAGEFAVLRYSKAKDLKRRIVRVLEQDHNVQGYCSDVKTATPKGKIRVYNEYALESLTEYEIRLGRRIRMAEEAKSKAIARAAETRSNLAEFQAQQEEVKASFII